MLENHLIMSETEKCGLEFKEIKETFDTDGEITYLVAIRHGSLRLTGTWFRNKTYGYKPIMNLDYTGQGEGRKEKHYWYHFY